MPAFGIKNTTKKDKNRVQTKHDFKTKEELGTSVIFNKDIDIKDISKVTSGMKWEVVYFSQILGKNDKGSMPDINVPSTIIKYNRIDNLPLKITTPIQQNHGNDTISGEGILSFVTPHYGDAILARMSGGQYGIFYVDDLKKVSYNNTEQYEITFKLLANTNKDEKNYNDLIYKTINEYTYDTDYSRGHDNPIILSKDYTDKLDIVKVKTRLLDDYLNEFVDTKTKYLGYRDQHSSLIVDTYLTDFFNKIVSVSDNLKLLDITGSSLYPTDKVNNTIWNYIINRRSDLSLVNKDLKIVRTTNYRSDPRLRNLVYTGVAYTVGKGTGSNVINDTYVFSSSFYSNKESDITLDIEKLLLIYLKGDNISIELVKKAIEDLSTHTPIQRYYYTPILILIIGEVIYNSYGDL